MSGSQATPGVGRTGLRKQVLLLDRLGVEVGARDRYSDSRISACEVHPERLASSGTRIGKNLIFMVWGPLYSPEP